MLPGVIDNADPELTFARKSDYYVFFDSPSDVSHSLNLSSGSID